MITVSFRHALCNVTRKRIVKAAESIIVKNIRQKNNDSKNILR